MLDRPTTNYFRFVRERPDRVMIEDSWITRVVLQPDREAVQEDGRIRRWKRIPEAGDRALRVILLADGMTIHNAFFDRDFAEESDAGQIL